MLTNSLVHDYVIGILYRFVAERVFATSAFFLRHATANKRFAYIKRLNIIWINWNAATIIT